MGVKDNVPSAAACCRECTALNVNATSRVCTLFNYCSQPGGCSYTHQQNTNMSVALQQGQCELAAALSSCWPACRACLLASWGRRFFLAAWVHGMRVAKGSCLPLLAGELRYQPLSTSITSLPPSLLASGDGVPFEAGAPNLLWEPEVPGFRRLPGESVALSRASFACQGSLRCVAGAAGAGRNSAASHHGMPAPSLSVDHLCPVREGTLQPVSGLPAVCRFSHLLCVRPETGECVLPGTLQESADYCSRTEQCGFFAIRPGALPTPRYCLLNNGACRKMHQTQHVVNLRCNEADSSPFCMPQPPKPTPQTARKATA